LIQLLTVNNRPDRQCEPRTHKVTTTVRLFGPEGTIANLLDGGALSLTGNMLTSEENPGGAGHRTSLVTTNLWILRFEVLEKERGGRKAKKGRRWDGRWHRAG
jgi:hypothetical protein